ncbi:MAG: hypothetical protein KF685_04370 [Acidobacteria bacterium]|nr:hypothetical protein [Acidobacteriota bacterium]
MRELTENIESQFVFLKDTILDLVDRIPEELLFRSPFPAEISFQGTCGECILRAAAAAEQAFGGIMTRLWDDPFEWTLPEALSSSAQIKEYVLEVDDQRIKCFKFISSDADLLKLIPAPEEFKPIQVVLVDALCRSHFLLGQAVILYRASAR